MPLSSRMSPATIMHDLKHGPHHGERTHKQEVAIMESVKRGGRKRKKHHRKRKHRA